jgi:hypothetical protein
LWIELRGWRAQRRGRRRRLRKRWGGCVNREIWGGDEGTYTSREESAAEATAAQSAREVMAVNFILKVRDFFILDLVDRREYLKCMYVCMYARI